MSETSKNKTTDSEFLSVALKRWKASSTAFDENRRNALDDLNFLAGNQWPDKILKDRETAGRPCLTINRLPGFIDQVVGDQRQNRPRIKVRPVDSKSDPELAEIIEGLVRNIEYLSCGETVYDIAFEQAVSGGFGYFRVLTKYADDDVFDQDIFIEVIKNPFSVYFDPSAKKHDYSDANWAFITEDLSLEDFEARWPKAVNADFEKGTGEAYTEWWQEDKRRVAEYWVKKPTEKTIVLLSNGMIVEEKDATPEKLMELAGGPQIDPATGQAIMPAPVTIKNKRKVKTHKVCQYFLTASEILEGPNEWAGKYIPIIPVLGKELVVDGRTLLRGLIRFAKDPQRMYNYWRTTVTELVALAPKTPFLATVKQIEGHEEIWRTANTVPHSYLPYNSTSDPMPQRVLSASLPQGAFTEAQVAVDDMKGTTGIYDASLGNRGNETSGKAIIARQREGDVATYAFIDNLSRAISHAGRVILDLIPSVYDTERVVRIRNIDDTERFETLNTPGLDKDGDPTIFRDITVGKYDVVVETGPSYSTQRQESAEAIVKIMQALPNQSPLIADIAIKNMDIIGAQEIAERLQKTLPPGMLKGEDGKETPRPAPPPPSPQMMLEAKKMELENKKLDVEARKVEKEGEDTDSRMRLVAIGVLQELLSPGPGPANQLNIGG